MSNAIVKQEVNMDELQRMAKMLAYSGYFEASTNEVVAVAQMATKILAGRELGYGPFTSVQGIHVIKGKPSLSANLMAAAVKAHPRYDYRVRKMDNEEVSIEFFENKESIGISSFTKQDAIAAQTQNLSKFARNMLFARAMSNGVRFYCPDVFYGNTVYTPDELGETVDYETGEIIEAAQPQEQKQIEQQPEPELIDSQDGPVEPKPEASPARKRLHAEGTATFAKQWDDARHWLVERYTKTATPDNVRNSSNELSDDECDVIADKLVAHRNFYQNEWKKAPPVPQPVATGK